MDVTQVVQQVQGSKEFHSFQKDHPDYYLTHLFCMFVHDQQSSWQVGFYSKKTDRIVVFEHTGKEVIRHKEEDVFKKKKFVKRLKLDQVIPFEEALSIADKHKKAKYPKEIEKQRIVILQNIDEGIVWNITMISEQLNMLNLKIKAQDGHIVKESFDSILRLGKDKV